MSNKNKSKQTNRQKINKKRQKNKSLETLSPRRPFHNRPTKKNYLFQTKSLHKVRSKAIRMFSSPSYHPRWVDKWSTATNRALTLTHNNERVWTNWRNTKYKNGAIFCSTLSRTWTSKQTPNKYYNKFTSIYPRPKLISSDKDSKQVFRAVNPRNLYQA